MAIKLIVDIFGVVIEMFLLAYVYTTLLGKSKRKRWQLIGLYGATGLLILLSTTILERPSQRTFCFLWASVLPAFVYSGKWSHKIFYAFLFTAVVSMVESCISFILIFAEGETDDATYLARYIRGVFISKFTATLAVLFFLFYKQKKEGEIPAKLLGIFLILPIATMVTIHQMMKVNHSIGNQAGYLISAIGTFLLILANIVLFYLFDKQRELESLNRAVAINKKQQEVQKEAYGLMANRITAHNKLVHDMDHHLTAIGSYAEKGEIAPLLAYLQQLKGWSDHAKIFYIGDTAIDSILNVKLEQAKTQGSQLVYSIFKTADIKIQPLAVVTVLANGLDNALEAVAKIPAPQEEPISCKITVEADNLTIAITNPMAKPMSISPKQIFASSKTDKTSHGLGLGNIKETAQSCGGSMFIRTEGTKFILSVTMPNQALHS